MTTKGPYQLRRIALPDAEYFGALSSIYLKEGAVCVFELYSTRTNEIVDWQESSSPFCPDRLLRAQRKLNSKAVLNKHIA